MWACICASVYLVLVFKDVAVKDLLAHPLVSLKPHVDLIIWRDENIVPVARSEPVASSVGGIGSNLEGVYVVVKSESTGFDPCTFAFATKKEAHEAHEAGHITEETGAGAEACPRTDGRSSLADCTR